MALWDITIEWCEYGDAIWLWFEQHFMYLKQNLSIEKSLNQNPYLVTRFDHNCLIIQE